MTHLEIFYTVVICVVVCVWTLASVLGALVKSWARRRERLAPTSPSAIPTDRRPS